MDEKTLGIVIGSAITLIVGGLAMYFARKNLRIQLENQTNNLKIQLEHQRKQEISKIQLVKLEELHRNLTVFALTGSVYYLGIVRDLKSFTNEDYKKSWEIMGSKMGEIITLIDIYAPELSFKSDKLLDSFQSVNNFVNAYFKKEITQDIVEVEIKDIRNICQELINDLKLKTNALLKIE